MVGVFMCLTRVLYVYEPLGCTRQDLGRETCFLPHLTKLLNKLMSYIKIINSGSTVETYEYEYDLVRKYGGSRKRGSEALSDSDVAFSGEDSLPERNSSASMGKRPDNARRASLAFRRIVSSNLGGGFTLPVLVTLTYADNFTDLKGAYKHFSNFINTCRRRFGREFKYVCVPEFQKRGAVHFHALFWGIPEEVLFLERKNRTVRGIWGFGHVFIKRTDGASALAFYLAKYFTKAYLDPRLKNQKSYVASRNIRRPEVFAGNFNLKNVLFEMGVNGDPEVERVYQTKYFGEGRYQLFTISHDES